jgi:hypothetical protein
VVVVERVVLVQMAEHQEVVKKAEMAEQAHRHQSLVPL